MDGLKAMLAVLDTRSFASAWYWLLVAGLWSWIGRGALGVPADLVRAVLRDPGNTAAHRRLLDWIALVAPRWRVGPREAAVLVGAVCFALSALAALGFGFHRQFAQALVLLLGPMAVIAALRVRLAARLDRMRGAVVPGDTGDTGAAAAAARAIVRHLRLTAALAVVSVAVSAFWAARWLALHPNGL